MSYFWFLKLIVKCLEHCAWPLLALGYPLCASVQAIETDSYKETKNLISYWILLSLIYLFEYAFSRLLQWYQVWPYTKLMIILWLIVPDFGRASYAYNNIIRTWISNPQAIICSLNNCRKIFVKKDNFLVHAERYLEENGTEALMNLIASKNTTNNAVADAEEMQQTNEKKDLEVTERKDIPTDNRVKWQYIPVVPKPVQSENASATMLESKGILTKGKGVEELPQSSTHREVQKEWTCALCQVTTTSEKTLNSHLQGSKHRVMENALKARNQPASDYNEELKQKNINYQPSYNRPKYAENLQKKPAGINYSEVICEICNVKCPCEITLASHRNGRKHLAKVQNYNGYY